MCLCVSRWVTPPGRRSAGPPLAPSNGTGGMTTRYWIPPPYRGCVADALAEPPARVDAPARAAAQARGHHGAHLGLTSRVVQDSPGGPASAERRLA